MRLYSDFVNSLLINYTNSLVSKSTHYSFVSMKVNLKRIWEE